MENKTKKSKAFIITFVVVILLLLGGYLLFKSITKAPETKNIAGENKTFSPLLGEGEELTRLEFPDSYLKTFPTKRVIAIAGEDLKKGDVVYIDSFSNDGLPIVKKAIAGDPKKSIVFGVANEDIKAGEKGEITTGGQIKGLNTNRKEGTMWSVGDQLYLSTIVAGEMTKNGSSDPSLVIPIGVVSKVGVTDGIVNVGGKGTTTSSWVDFVGTVFTNNMNIRMGEAGENLKRGDVVYISGFNASGLPILKKAIAGDPVKEIIYGVVNNGSNTGGLIEVVTGGIMTNIAMNQDDSNSWLANEQLYLSKLSSGKMTNQLSSSSTNGILVAVVISTDENLSTINVGGKGTDASSWNNFTGTPMQKINKIGSGSANNKGAFGNFIGTIGDTLASGWNLVTTTIGSWIDSILGGNLLGNGTINTGGFGNGQDVCWNGATNYPKCSTDSEGNCLNGATNPEECTENIKNDDDEKCSNGAINPPNCTVGENGECLNGATNPEACTISQDGTCLNGAINPEDCTEYNECSNGAVNSPECTVNENGECLNGATNPTTCTVGLPTPPDDDTTKYPPTSENIPACSDGKDNDGDGKIDVKDNGCHVDNDLSKAYKTDKTSELETTTDTEEKTVLNKCQAVYENPLKFTVEEQKKLDLLLRKFYLIAPTLKTEEDIAMVYQMYDQNKEYISRVEELTKQCYLQTNNRVDYASFCASNPSLCSKTDLFNGSYTGPTTIYGNPWFKYTDRGTYTVTGAIDIGNSTYYDSTSISNMKDFETLLNVW